jgi:hypothetical protein
LKVLFCGKTLSFLWRKGKSYGPDLFFAEKDLVNNL